MTPWVRGIAAIAVASAVTACSGTVRSHNAAGPSPSPSASTPDPGPADEGPTPTVTTEASVGALQLHLPPGWASASDGQFGNICVQRPGHQPEVFGCGGLDIWFGWDSYLPGEEMTTFDPANPGWYHATDVQPCPVKPTDGPDHLNGIREDGRASAPHYEPVGTRTAYFFQWRAHCDNGFTFSPRAWYLPASKILIFDYVGNAGADALLQTATFDTGRWTFGFLRGDERTASNALLFNVDEAEWLSGDAAAYYARSSRDARNP